MNTPTTETAAPAATNPVIASIEAAALPAGLAPEGIRNLAQKERTTKIRNLLKACGIKGLSVTSATGSMCYWTHVRFPRVDHAVGTDMHSRFDCAVCVANLTASRKLSALIVEAFPDMGDRSDIQSDHFDFMFTVDGR